MNGRSVGIDMLKNKGIPGLYVINVPKAIKSYYKIGISETDIEQRLSSYILSYPFGFHIVALLLYKGDPESRYIKVRKAESEILIKKFRNKRVFRFKGMKTSEWLKLRNKKDFNELKQVLQEITIRDEAELTWFADSHSIKIPQEYLNY